MLWTILSTSLIICYSKSMKYSYLFWQSLPYTRVQSDMLCYFLVCPGVQKLSRLCTKTMDTLNLHDYPSYINNKNSKSQLSLARNESAEENWKILWMRPYPILFLCNTTIPVPKNPQNKAVHLLIVTNFAEGLMDKVTISSSGYASSVCLLTEKAFEQVYFK